MAVQKPSSSRADIENVSQALEEVWGQLPEGKAIFAYLDDLYVVAAPEWVRPVYNLLRDALWRHACVQLHAGKTRIWNPTGEQPAQVADLQPKALIWCGSGHGPSPPSCKA